MVACTYATSISKMCMTSGVEEGAGDSSPQARLRQVSIITENGVGGGAGGKKV